MVLAQQRRQNTSSASQMNGSPLGCNWTDEDRLTRAKWMRGMAVFYGCMALLVFGLILLTKPSGLAPDEGGDESHLVGWPAGRTGKSRRRSAQEGAMKTAPLCQPNFETTAQDAGSSRVVDHTAEMSLVCPAPEQQPPVRRWRVSAMFTATCQVIVQWGDASVPATSRPRSATAITRHPQDQSRGGSRALQSILVGMTSPGIRSFQRTGNRFSRR